MICKDTIGGVKELFLTPYVKLFRRTFLAGGYNGIVQPKIKPLYLMNVNASAGYSDFAYTQTLNFKTPNLINDTLLNDFKNNEYRAVIKDGNNNYWLLGKDNGLKLRTNNINTGTNKSDFNGYELSFEGKETETFYKLENVNQFIEGAVLFLSSSSELSSSGSKISNIYI